jgi:hypothetical protein
MARQTQYQPPPPPPSVHGQFSSLNLSRFHEIGHRQPEW